jgi:hypothetical protein
MVVEPFSANCKPKESSIPCRLTFILSKMWIKTKGAKTAQIKITKALFQLI